MDSLPIVKSCEGCGACCMTMGHPRYFWNQEQGTNVDELWIELPKSLVAEIETHLESLRGDEQADFGTPCIWFDDVERNCRHHRYKPQVCRDLEIGGEACLRSRRQFGII